MEHIQENKDAEATATPCLTALEACQRRRFGDLVAERLSGSQVFDPAHLAKLLRIEYFGDTSHPFRRFGRQKEFVDQLNAGFITSDDKNR